jgi:NADPH:quinone reductase-like Zn-dependent oxidoreductase
MVASRAVRVVEISRAGPPEVLVLREKPDPRPGPDEAVVEVRAVGVNFADIMGRMGLYPDAPPIPFVPGYEVAGDCEGRPVVVLTKFHGYSERVLVRRDQVFPLPEGLTPVEGAAIPVNYLTAWVALHEQARVRRGDRVLVEQGAGGVGLAALQICLHAGAAFVGVVSSEEKAKFLRERGGEAAIRGKPIDGTFDIILDPTGASALGRDFALLKTGGSIVLYGASEFVTGRSRNLLRTAWKYLRRPKVDPYDLCNRSKGIHGLNMLTYDRDASRLAMGKILEGVREGWLRPHVGATFPLEKAAEAHAYVQDRRNIGKVVLIVTPRAGG